MKRWILLLALLLLAMPAAAQDDPALLLFAHADPDTDFVDFRVDDRVVAEAWAYGRVSAPLPGPYSDTTTVTPGAYTISAQADALNLADPVKIEASAGSRTLVMFTSGRLTVYDLDALAPRPTATTSPWYYINATDAPLDIVINGEIVIDDLASFEAAAHDVPFTPFDEIGTAGNDPNEIYWEVGPSFDLPIYGEPLYTSIVIAVNEPEFVFTLFSEAAAPVFEQLRAINAADIPESAATTYVKAIELSGIEAELAAGDSVVYLIPNDDAFRNMDAAMLDAALDNREALSNLLRYHTIDASDFPTYANLPPDGETFTYETRQGAMVTVSIQQGTIFVNDVPVDFTVPAADGLQVRLSEVLTP